MAAGEAWAGEEEAFYGVAVVLAGVEGAWAGEEEAFGGVAVVAAVAAARKHSLVGCSALQGLPAAKLLPGAAMERAWLRRKLSTEPAKTGSPNWPETGFLQITSQEGPRPQASQAALG